MSGRLVVGTRGSALARAQTEAVAEDLRAAHPGLEVVIEIIRTTGDEASSAPLSEIGGTGAFTKELEDALLDGRISVAVHSLKDLPTKLPEGLILGAVPPRATAHDALITREAPSLQALPEGAVVGTSSVRRKAFLAMIRPGLKVVEFRGNIDTRLRKVEEGVVDAAILACAGLERLGRDSVIQTTLPASVMMPAPGQGALALEIRAGDEETAAIVKAVHCHTTAAAVRAERACLAGLGSGCQVPLGALAIAHGAELRLETCLATPDGKQWLRETAVGPVDRPEAVGRDAADALREEGADALLEAAG